MFSTDPKIFDWLVEVRRYFHMHPEISHQEYGTTKKIASLLKSMGVDVSLFDDMTGAVGTIKGATGEKTLGLRADIDALPMQELNTTDYKSLNDEVMHSCGHDANTTVMLGTAKKIVDTGLADTMNGNVKFIFQPAEERGAGAKAMIARGVLENPHVNRVIACHMSPDLPVGKVGIFHSTGYASGDRFALQINGRGGHGGRPEECVDPVVAGSFFVNQIQSIVSRNIKPTEAAVVSVGKFVAGNAANVIPETAVIEGSIRALTAEVRDQVFQRLEDMAYGLEKTFEVQCEFNIQPGVPILINNSEVAESLYDVSVNVLGPENVSYLPPIMGSEDFSYFTLERPSAIMRLGCSNEKRGIVNFLHSPYFDIDETVLEIGTEIFYQAVKSYLSD
ncbi:MAG: amidohydrolase [Deltaproteobacteria bacterium]|nr:amidohydrolase [Deltaproteobacteria bacterium]